MVSQEINLTDGQSYEIMGLKQGIKGKNVQKKVRAPRRERGEGGRRHSTVWQAKKS